MKKLITIILVAIVPFVTVAQKRSKKNKTTKSEIKTSTVNFMVIKGISFSGFDNEEDLNQMALELHHKGGNVDKVQIWFDFGNINHDNDDDEISKLTKEAKDIYSMTDAVNFLGNYGWEFSSANIERTGSLTTYYYYMKRD